jgi:hypothetical protein
MPSESELRDSLRDPRDPDGAIDVDAVLRRARARRRPRVILATGAGALALAGVLVPVGVLALGTTPPGALSVTADEQGGAAPEPADGDTGIELAAADRLQLCGEPLAEVGLAANGLVLEIDPVDATATAETIDVTVTLRNTGSSTVRGITAVSPAMTLSGAGTVLWHSNGLTPDVGVMVDLDPGESLAYPASFTPVVCAAVDDATGFREDLPAAGAGAYELRAAIDLVEEDGSRVLVTGPPAAVTLR